MYNVVKVGHYKGEKMVNKWRCIWSYVLVQDLALKGQFGEVEKQFDKKKADKAQEYVLGKLKSLAEIQKNGESTSNVTYATPFMLFAVKEFNDETVSDLSLTSY